MPRLVSRARGSNPRILQLAIPHSSTHPSQVKSVVGLRDGVAIVRPGCYYIIILYYYIILYSIPGTAATALINLIRLPLLYPVFESPHCIGRPITVQLACCNWKQPHLALARRASKFKSSQVVGLRTRAASIRAISFSYPHPY